LARWQTVASTRKSPQPTPRHSASIGPGYVRRGALMDINLWGQNLFRFFTYTEVTPLRLTPPTLLVADVTHY